MMNDSMYISPYQRSCTGPMRRKTGSMFGKGFQDHEVASWRSDGSVSLNTER